MTTDNPYRSPGEPTPTLKVSENLTQTETRIYDRLFLISTYVSTSAMALTIAGGATGILTKEESWNFSLAAFALVTVPATIKIAFLLKRVRRGLESAQESNKKLLKNLDELSEILKKPSTGHEK